MTSPLRRHGLVLLVSLLGWTTPLVSLAGVISYLRFEEGSGYAAADETGLMNGELLEFNEFTGWSTDVPAATVPLTGQANTGSLYFGPGFVDLSNANDVYLGYSFTLEFFFNAEAPGLGSLFYGFSGGSILSWSLGEDPYAEGLLMGGRFQGQLDIIPASTVLLNTWQHFALVKTPGGYQVYIDGALIADESLPSGTDGPYSFAGTAMTGDRTIGGDDGTFRGWIDEFRISDEALTPDQFLCAIPEPSTLGLILLGAAGLAWRRRM
ncbi:MAG: PEP-CTERM sorting domain-containing protein [Bacteroidia bacterium]|nr:PEP-CTERM sorting domain-containing protein [Bacteroidia bacterium]